MQLNVDFGSVKTFHQVDNRFWNLSLTAAFIYKKTLRHPDWTVSTLALIDRQGNAKYQPASYNNVLTLDKQRQPAAPTYGVDQPPA